MKLQYLILFSGLGLAICAAYYSIIGIAGIFAGSAISIGIVAAFLEIGKISFISFIYKYWDKCTNLLKIYSVVSLIILTIITSAGIGGMLLYSYQKSSIDYKLNQEKILSIESSKGFYTNQIYTSQKRIDILNDTRKMQEARLSEALTNVFLSRNVLQLQQLQQQTIQIMDKANEDIKNETDKIEKIRLTLQGIDDSINKMKIGASEKKDIQTFKFVAEALNTDLDTVAKYFIILLMCVFDPLAIALILAYNVVVYNKPETKVIDTSTDEIRPEIKSGIKEEIKTEVKREVPVTESVVIIPEVIKDDYTVHNNSMNIISETSSISSINSEPVITTTTSTGTSANDEYYKRMFKQ